MGTEEMSIEENSPGATEQTLTSAAIPLAALDRLLEGCQVIDREYRYLYLNEAAAQHGRQQARELVGRRMADVYPGIEHTEMFETLRRCMVARVPSQMENAFLYPDGTRRWFELRFEPHEHGVTVLSIDITERKESELALARTVRALNTLSRCNRALVRSDDEQKLLSEVCELVVGAGGYRMAWIGLLDRKRPTLVRPAASAGLDDGYTQLTRVDLSAPAGAMGPVARALETGEPALTRFIATDAEYATWRSEALERGYASCIALPIKDSGECIGTLTIYSSDEDAFDAAESELLEEVALDLGYGVQTLRQRAAQQRTFAELAEERSRTRAIYDHLPHPSFVFGLGPAGFRLLDFNKAADALTRGELERRIGEPAQTFQDEIPEITSDLFQCVYGRESIEREALCRLPGATNPCQMALSYGVIPPNLVLLHAQDVTEQRLTEIQLAASQRLEAVGRLAGGLAHDFNNLLSVVLAYAEIGLYELGPEHPLAPDLAQIRDAGQRAANLTRQLLAFSRKQILEPRRLDANEVLMGLEPMLRRLLGEDIDFVIRRAPNLGTVIADPGQLEQVIVNLAVNARDAMPRGGTLAIETENVDPIGPAGDRRPGFPEGSFVLLSVTDSGDGMDAETRSHVFEPFFTTKDKSKGSGLGLSTVYGIVKQSGGHIFVESELGKGARFEILLPRVNEAPDGPVVEAPASVTRGTETILLVEDEAAVRAVAERILSGAGYRVLAAANAEEAIRLAEEHGSEIELLLTDVVMPGMGGPELAAHLTNVHPGLGVLFASGYTDNALTRHGALDPGTLFVAKPYTIAELTTRVRNALDAARSQ